MTCLWALLGTLTMVATPASSRATGTAAPPLTGDPRGVALINRINASYVNVPAVRTSAHATEVSVTFELYLRHGVTWAEHAVVTTASGTTVLVGTLRGGTFARDPGRTCWRFLPRSSDQALEDLGNPLLVGPGRVHRPRTNGNHLVVDLIADGKRETVVADRRNMHVVFVRTIKPSLIVRFAALASAPGLPTPKPRC
jgi:hypothetical protein